MDIDRKRRVVKSYGSIEYLYFEGNFRDCESCLFIDNIVADYAYDKGSSSYKSVV